MMKTILPSRLLLHCAKMFMGKDEEAINAFSENDFEDFHQKNGSHERYQHSDVEYTEADFDDTGAEEEGMVRLFINLGKNQRIRPGDIVGAIAVKPEWKAS